MYLQKVISRKSFFKIVFCWHLEGQGRKYQDPDPLVIGTEAQQFISPTYELSNAHSSTPIFGKQCFSLINVLKASS
jgi:hypothetical protein